MSFDRGPRLPNAGRAMHDAAAPRQPDDEPLRPGLRSERGRLGREHSVQLVARADIELGEDLAEVVLDGAPADEQPRTDLRVRHSVARQTRDLALLRRELVARLDV